MKEFDQLRRLFEQRYNVASYDCEAEEIMRQIEAGSGSIERLRAVVSEMALYRRMPEALALIDQVVVPSSLPRDTGSPPPDEPAPTRRGRRAVATDDGIEGGTTADETAE